MAVVGILVRRHYARVRHLTRNMDRQHRWLRQDLTGPAPVLDTAAPTAVLLVSAHRGIGLHTVDRVESLFPGHFRNFVFVSVGEVDSHSYGSDQLLRTLQYETRATLDALVNYVHHRGKGARWYDAYGSDRLAQLESLALEVRATFPNSVCFASRVVFEKEHWWNRWLHSQTPLNIQRILSEHDIELVVLPVMLREETVRSGSPPHPTPVSA